MTAQNFFIPELGYAQQLSPQLAVGVAVYGNGGMNTNYGTSPFTTLGQGASIGSGGVDLSQLFISPSLAWKINENHALGIALNLAYQRFKIEGVQPFAWAAIPSRLPTSLTTVTTVRTAGASARLHREHHA